VHACYVTFQRASIWTDLDKRPTEATEYGYEIWHMQVRREGGGTEPAGEYTFFYGKGNENHELGTELFMHKRII
jgi:hypothetical protein